MSASGINASNRFHFVGGKCLIGDKVIETRGTVGGRSKRSVGDIHVALRAPHGKGRMSDVPGSGEHFWGGRDEALLGPLGDGRRLGIG